MRAIVGTAGHIDHGKSALVRALTGIDPDRLPAEKERGISIELGFAHLETADGDRIGIVDVPGHERFIRQMLAGAQGFDYVLVVVAADDGVMPQTEEHFEMCHLLGLRHGAFVVSKCDLVGAGRIDEVREEIEVLAEGSAFADAPVFVVSAVSGEGIDALREHLVATVPGIERRPRAEEPFRLPIDRVFVSKGHGVVVTGTAASGAVTVGDEVVVAPGGPSARVREVQVHGHAVERAWSGQRVALNLAAVSQHAVARGQTVVHAGAISESRRFDARVEVRPAARRALRSQERVRVHLGTASARARLRWLEAVDEVEPKRSAFAEIVVASEPVLALAGDRFVLRDETDQRTIGGGVVLLAPVSERQRRGDPVIVESLRRIESSEPSERMGAYLRLHGALCVTVEEAARGARVSVDEAAAMVAQSAAFVRLGGDGQTALVASRARHDVYVEALIARLAEFHADLPSAPGIELERLRREVRPVLEPRAFRAVVDGVVAKARGERKGSVLAAPGHRPTMGSVDEPLVRAVLDAIEGGGAMPPSVAELPERCAAPPAKLQQILGLLVARGAVVKVSTDLYFAKDVLAAIESRLRERLEHEDSITAAGFRDLISASRKYSIPLLDHFDRSGLTVRIGDLRRLRPRG